MAGQVRLRIATYNVHKCRGMDGKTRPERIAAILQRLDADVIGVQEILDVRGGAVEMDQVRHLAGAMPGYTWSFGENRKLGGGGYGNLTLSRLAVESFENYDLTHAGYERRGCLRASVKMEANAMVHAFNLHLGTGFVERRHQAQYLLGMLDAQPWSGPRVIFGDFNEWTRGLATRRMAERFSTFEPKKMLQRSRTYPGLLPLLHLDHFYYDAALELVEMQLVRDQETLLASDHLPLVADFSLPR